MKINPHIFRAYDIRGIAETDLTDEVAKYLGLGFGTYLKRKYKKERPNIVVGGDVRVSTPTLKHFFMDGLRQTGCNVTDIGTVMSPMVYFATCNNAFDGGVSVTASHNPKEYNGFKFVGRQAHSICADELQEIRKMIDANDFDLDCCGTFEQLDIEPSYSEKIASMVKLERPISVVIDAGNGAAAPFAEDFFKRLGCQVECLYCEPDGTFPNHEANPEEYANMQDLIAKVQETGADIGIGFDGDGDRVGVVDELGNHYHADKLLLLLARDLLKRHPGAKIVHDLKCSKVLEDDIKAHGGEPVVCKTGHSHIETKIRDTGALLGGEVSGHMFFKENYFGFDDAFVAAAKLIEILSQHEGPFSSLLSAVPVMYNTPEIKAACPDDKKFDIVAKLTQDFEREYRCMKLDGVRMSFDDNSWGIIRCSNTSPNLTLRFESDSEERLKEIMDIAVEKIKQYPEVNVSWHDNY